MARPGKGKKKAAPPRTKRTSESRKAVPSVVELPITLIEKHKKQGFVTYDEINEALPSAVVSSKQIDAVMTMLADNDIEVRDTAASILWTPKPTPPPPAPATLRSDYDVRYLADVLVEAQRWVSSTNPDSTYHLTQARAAADAFGMPQKDPKRSRRDRDDADDFRDLVYAVVEAIVSRRSSPFSSGLEGRPTTAYRLGRRFQDRFEACDRATTSVLDKMLMAVLKELVGADKTISNDDLIKQGFDPWAAPPKPEDLW